MLKRCLIRPQLDCCSVVLSVVDGGGVKVLVRLGRVATKNNLSVFWIFNSTILILLS